MEYKTISFERNGEETFDEEYGRLPVPTTTQMTNFISKYSVTPISFSFNRFDSLVLLYKDQITSPSKF